jgi:light-regulated signal transduction histidine kinase (bacteriophytochrome)
MESENAPRQPKGPGPQTAHAVDGVSAELTAAYAQLVFQNGEKEKRAAELVVANRELVFQNGEKEKRAAELVVANAQLQSAIQELEAFAYSVSHDLKAPLRHISGYVSLLKKRYSELLPEEGRKYLENVSFSASSMGEQIDGLLEFSKAGRIEVNMEPVDMNGIVDELLQPVREQDVDHRIELRVQSMPQVDGDRAMIRSVWSNLIDNAVKFSRDRRPATIAIGASAGEREVVFFIKDNGVGFDMAYASKLFDIFQRMHSHTQFEGTGIGLATVRRIVARHGGRTWAEAEVGEGATFFFSLPKRKGSG